MSRWNKLSFKAITLSIMFATQTFFFIAALPSYGLHVAESTAMTAKDSVYLFDKERTKLFILYRAESFPDVSIYGQLLTFSEPYRAQSVQVLPYAVAKYGGEASKFLTFAPDVAEWNLHNWLSYDEYQKLTNDLKNQGISAISG